ncbi:unnamed protein product [Rotaria sp. Silwood2]|nr:unnamed protein product [Rotaria sp. Silwood2]CAF4126658.1 unnamed protein product [Rotaria sp. Silwood2]
MYELKATIYMIIFSLFTNTTTTIHQTKNYYWSYLLVRTRRTGPGLGAFSFTGFVIDLSHSYRTYNVQ